MSAARKPHGAAKPDKTPATSKAKAGPKDKSKTPPKAKTPPRAPATQSKVHPLATPVYDPLLPEFKDAKTLVFGGGGRVALKAGDRFIFRRWPYEALLDLEHVVFGDQDPISLPVWVAVDDAECLTKYIRKARACHVEFVIPVYLDIARRSLAGNQANKPADPKASIWAQPEQAPPEPVTPFLEMRQCAAEHVGRLLYLRQFNEAERCLRAHRRVEDAGQTWSSLRNVDMDLLRALVQALDTIQEGAVPTKKDIRDKALKHLPDKGQTTRILNLSLLLACLPGATRGTKPGARR